MKFIGMMRSGMVIFLALMSGVSLAQENKYALKNSSCVEIKVSIWFTNAIKGSRKAHDGDYNPGPLGGLPRVLPAPDVQVVLQPHETEMIDSQNELIKSGECLAYLVAEYRVIPSILPYISSSPGIPADLYLIGKRSWAQKLPGLCGSNVLELNYDPATYLKFTIKINGVEDYLQDVTKAS